MIPCKITPKGDKVCAGNFIGAARSQMRILENQLDFQGLKQGVRKVRLNPRVTVEAIVCFDLREVIIYCSPEGYREEIKELKEPCFIELLTFKIEGDCLDNLYYDPANPEIWEEESCIKERGFCLTPDGECNVELKSMGHPWNDKRNHHISQCRYVYEEKDEGEEEKITRKVSLFHYDSFPTLNAVPVNKVIRIKGHQDSPDLVLKYLILEPNIEASYYGALSEDLKTLYVSLFIVPGDIPRTEWFLYYSKYENIGDKWKCTKTSKTPVGMSFRDNAIDRKGCCGCWHYADDFITHNYTKSLVNCLTVSDGWMKHGTLNETKYKTFDIETETFIESEKVVGLHLNPVTEEFVTCKSEPGATYFYNLPDGSPNYFIHSIFSCHCSKCYAPYNHVISSHDEEVDYKYFYGGYSNEYTLFSGLETFPPLWDTFFYSGLNQHKKLSEQLTGSCPIVGGAYTCNGTAYDFDGGEMRALAVPFTSFVYAGHVKVGTETIESGCYSQPSGFITGATCHDGVPVWEVVPHMSPCGYNIETITQPVNIDTMELLSPFEMTLQKGDQIGNTFISYDEETDYLLRGIHFKPLDEPWEWKIYARLIGHDGSPYDCPEKDITDELKELLSEEYFYNIETMIFL